MDQATEAALEFTGGGSVTETEIGDEESLYEVEVTLDDGRQAQSLLSEMNGLHEIRLEEVRLTLFVDGGTLAVSQVIRTLDGAGVRVGHVAVSQPSLDEVFLKATGSRRRCPSGTSGVSRCGRSYCWGRARSAPCCGRRLS